MSVIYTLAQHGDAFEKEADRCFVQREFPGYEEFWRTYVVPLTRRDEILYSINFKPDAPDDRVCIAELHYTVLRHLYSVYRLRAGQRLVEPGLDSHEFLARGFTSLFSACDVAHELIGRLKNPGTYEPWNAECGKTSGRQARHAWAKGHEPTSVRDLRRYRNHLTHGRFSPVGVTADGTVWFPRPGTEHTYFDWRRTPDPAHLSPARAILDDAWTAMLRYLDGEWRKHLLHSPRA